jgi:hypothetical protein
VKGCNCCSVTGGQKKEGTSAFKPVQCIRKMMSFFSSVLQFFDPQITINWEFHCILNIYDTYVDTSSKLECYTFKTTVFKYLPSVINSFFSDTTAMFVIVL